jgi:hypothetical protein
MLYVDSVLGRDMYKFRDARRSAQVKIASVIASTYEGVFPTLAIFGATGLLWAAFFRRLCPVPRSLLALGLASAVAVGTLIVLMAYLAASSDFNVANVLYTSPASPFVIIFTTLGIYSWYVTLREAHRQLSHQRHSSLRAKGARPDPSHQTPSGAVGV